MKSLAIMALAVFLFNSPKCCAQVGDFDDVYSYVQAPIRDEANNPHLNEVHKTIMLDGVCDPIAGEVSDISGTIFQGRSWILPIEKPSNPKSEWIEKNGFRFDCLSGTPVRCVAEGRVLYAGWYGGYGKLVIVNHGANLQTWYAHLKKFFVQVDEDVHSGQRIGQVGQTGFSTKPHLLFEVRRNGKPTVAMISIGE